MQMPAPSFIAQSYAPPMQPHADFSGMERQLSHMTSQIEQLRRPDPIMEQSIASFRSELADIRHAITEAMPRRAIESLETEIRSLGRRGSKGRITRERVGREPGGEQRCERLRRAVVEVRRGGGEAEQRGRVEAERALRPGAVRALA